MVFALTGGRSLINYLIPDSVSYALHATQPCNLSIADIVKSMI